MELIAEPKVRDATVEVIEGEPNALFEKVVYASESERGGDEDVTTLEFRMHRGDNKVILSWYVPLEFIDQSAQILPGGRVEGNTDGYPVDDAWDSKRYEPATTSAELGDWVEVAATKIQEAIAEAPYPTTPVGEFEVVTVYTNNLEPHCSLATSFTIK